MIIIMITIVMRPGGLRRAGAAPLLFRAGGRGVRDFKDTVCRFFESDTLFLECVFLLCLVV